MIPISTLSNVRKPSLIILKDAGIFNMRALQIDFQPIPRGSKIFITMSVQVFLSSLVLLLRPICPLYEDLRITCKSSHFNPAKKIKNALHKSAIYYLLTANCQCLQNSVAYKTRSFKHTGFKHLYKLKSLNCLVCNDTTFKIVPYTKPC